ncbi:hypothetical protein Pst134EA_019181 [Puccinia striiformis f. sp. tritici]|uniref:hypothetical protein n=1 Tax=Puccinia striiformis f. sp. tritici TaxID=168172 RepID=UPI002007B237|nr:hypothetical protein Pst134EA_019181 [Puccinia striiformis f. sp. tritici]KAH9459031.1 hypothetical protein Pst134EA_019181 [Puccinia striiformis f. sp. tritici]
MMSIKFITILLVLAFTSEAWGFKCGTAGKTNGVCATKKRKVFKSVTHATANGDELNFTTRASFCCDKKAAALSKNGQANGKTFLKACTSATGNAGTAAAPAAAPVN